ncbi:MAG: hypothetical protein KGM24_01395, partial [Elusimicrobia bacterium]|nr:hypothetical protein [Elusimicrobiota bacterium]
PARRLLDAREPAAAAAALERMIASPDFAALSPAARTRALALAGAARLELGQWHAASVWLKRASLTPAATSKEWRYRLKVDEGAEIYPIKAGEDDVPEAELSRDAALTLATLAWKWPAAAGALDDALVEPVLASDAELPRPLRLDVLRALFLAHWKRRGRFEPDRAWRDLARLLIEDGRLDEAAAVVARIEDPYVLIGMRADKRFDPVASVLTGQDVSEAALAQVLRLTRYAESGPRSLERWLFLTHELLAVREDRIVLQLTDDSVAPGSGPRYKDAGLRNWELDDRARALEGLGRWDEAVVVLERAQHLSEGGDVNVSQSINLASLLVSLGRPRRALAAVAGLAAMSPYGRMQVEEVRLEAALERGRRRDAARALDYLRAHASDAPRTYLDALVEAGRPAEAAARLIALLKDPDERTETLTELQHYDRGPLTRRDRRSLARWDALLARTDVRAEIAAVGRRLRYRLAPPD